MTNVATTPTTRPPWRRLGRIALALVVSLVLLRADAGGGPGDNALLSAPGSARGATLAAPATGQIQARNGKFWLGTQEIVLHGTNARTPCCTAQEYAQMASWGFNVVRLQFQWARAEPTAPVKNANGTWTHTYDMAYVNSFVSSVVRAQQAGLYVVTNNGGCECAYFRYPDWLYSASYNSKGITYPATPVGALQADTDFWSDALRQQFMIEGLVGLAVMLRSQPGVMGYEMMNEPAQGALPDEASTTETILGWQLRAAQAVRAADPARVVMFTTRSGYAPGVAEADLSGFTALGNVAFDAHDYFGARWGSGLLETPAQVDYHQTLQPVYAHLLDAPVGVEGDPYIGTTYGHVRWIQRLTDTLKPLGIPLFVGEFGARGDYDDGVYLYFGSITAAMNHLGVSWASSIWDGNEGFANKDGTLKPWAYLVIDAA